MISISTQYEIPTNNQFCTNSTYPVLKILEIENYTYEESISFGDGFNDERMLVATGKGLIMENAVESLKTKLSNLEVISSNDEDGVARYLSENIL